MSRPARRTGCAAPARWSICSSAASSIRDTGALIEFFAEDWSPAPGDRGTPARAGTSVRMGVAAARISIATRTTTASSPYAERLFAFGTHIRHRARRRPAGAVFDGVDATGALVAGTKLLWPQTEYHQGLRGARRMAERRGGARRDQRASRADRAVTSCAPTAPTGTISSRATARRSRRSRPRACCITCSWRWRRWIGCWQLLRRPHDR